MSQAQLAAAAGVDTRQIRRYESGDQQPMLSVAVAVARALEITVGQLTGEPSHCVALTGDSWASWQTINDGQEVLTAQEVRLVQRRDEVRVEATTRGVAVEEDGHLWRGEMRLWDDEILMGWYTGSSPPA